MAIAPRAAESVERAAQHRHVVDESITAVSGGRVVFDVIWDEERVLVSERCSVQAEPSVGSLNVSARGGVTRAEMVGGRGRGDGGKNGGGKGDGEEHGD